MASTTPKSYYYYQPSEALAGVACALFGINALLALFQVIRKRAWIWLVMVLALLMECIGFGARTESAIDTTDRNAYIAQFLLIILAPVIMAGVIYVVFGRIVFHVVPAEARTTKLLWVPPRWVTPIFVAFDIVALLLQATGAALVAGVQATATNAEDQLNRGKTLALIGIGLQVTAFGLFSIIATRFHFTSKQFAVALKSKLLIAEGEKMATLEGSAAKFNPNWRVILFAVNASCALILIRSIYRIIEFTEGKTGYVDQYEWFLYVFDALPIFLAATVYNIFPPSSYLPNMAFRVSKKINASGATMSGNDDREYREYIE
ncbi:RTA1 like protein-domain-containing protein [Xylariales sp. PMI_506]|nr:RTA1 like protein-domain-containing protein [Xylariales sp. PMI_506]